MKEEGIIDNTEMKGCGNEDFRSESIAALRAKALQHSARMLEALNSEGKADDTASEQSFDSSFFSDADDPGNEHVRHWYALHVLYNLFQNVMSTDLYR